MSEKDEAQARLAECPVKVGQIYRHYKGGLYSVVAVSLKEDDLNVLITYHSNLKATSWTRTLENFTEWVETPDNPSRKRFVREVV